MDVNLYWMKDVLKHMKKFTPTVPKLPAGFGRSGATWFFHTAKSRRWRTTSTTSCCRRSRKIYDDKDAPLRGGALYLDGKKLAEDPEGAGSRGTATVPEGLHLGVENPVVFVGAGERYDEEAWRRVHHRRRTPARGVGCGCVMS